MHGKYFIAFLLLTLCFNAFSQSKIDTLLNERTELYKNYSVLKDQKSSFWGKQSKEDLRKIITTLKGIINKDDEIVQEILNQHAEEKVNIRKQGILESSDLTLRERNLTERVRDLNNQLGSSLSQLSVKVKENQILRADFEKEKGENNILEKLLALLLLISIGMAFYIYRQNKNTKKV